MQMTSGALNPDSKDAIGHASIFYESIRKQSSDIFYISRNTNFTYEQVSLIKGHIFFNKHDLKEGIDRFFPDYMMAESWRRLSSKSGNGIQQHDILMLYHELQEIQYISMGCPQSEAHERANMIYNYDKCAKDFYRSQGFK